MAKLMLGAMRLSDAEHFDGLATAEGYCIGWQEGTLPGWVEVFCINEDPARRDACETFYRGFFAGRVWELAVAERQKYGRKQ